MGKKSAVVSAHLSPENIEFIEDWYRQLRPHPISLSSLVDLCVKIVRKLHEQGQLESSPAALQKLFEHRPEPGRKART